MERSRTAVPADLRVADFDFNLPADLIAQSPPAERGTSRLMHLERASGRVRHHTFADLPLLLMPGDLLVLNDTKVFPARLLGTREPGKGAVECLLMSRVRGPEGGTGDEDWAALVSPGARVGPGTRLRFEGPGGRLEGEVIARTDRGRVVRLASPDGTPVAAVVERIGHMPLPPYIKRPDAAPDRERYQTVYARHPGSIAAPTAGLHFTPGVFAALDAAGVERTTITLHVGYGTFKPVRVERVADHVVDPERVEVTAETAAALTRARQQGRRIVAVGTTTVRALESLTIAANGTVEPMAGEARLFIHPGHRFRLVDGLITNFHLPKSSLLLLVAAFGGREPVLAAYHEAVEHGYRFYSYGDAMLIL